ncbi:acyltransferase family protein [Aquisphaera insulae]|uniref:acyltransferase family protein n=1 Tax=Aquisphaera insulae TaxID=2712864 RepID=UPI0013ED5ABD|nr:acyltransferase [Aquisphaera insulae]
MSQGQREKSASNTHDRISQLDAMRGVAALVVCFGHAFSFFPWDAASFGSRLTRRAVYTLLDGAAMVDFFFVLSGFVLALPYVAPKGRRFDIVDFLTRRAVRIYPTYWVSLIFALVVRWLASDSFHAWAPTESGRSHWTAPITARDLALHFSLVFGVPNLDMLYGALWSICVEIQVAILLPLFFFLIGSARSWSAVAFVSTLSVVVACMFGLSTSLLFLPLFVMGVIAARYRGEIQARLRQASRSAAILLFLLGMSLIFNRPVTSRIGWTYPDVRTEMLSGLGAVLLIALADSRERFAALLRRKPLLALGKVSYSLYLIHVPLLMGVFPVFDRLTGSPAACIAGGIATAFALSWVVYLMVEEPSISVGRWLARTLVAQIRSEPRVVVNADQGEPAAVTSRRMARDESASDRSSLAPQ